MLCIHQTERKNPVELRDCADAVAGQAVQYSLRVGMPAKDLFSKAVPELEMVVDLSVERDGVVPTRGGHRLVARHRQVHNGQPAMSQRRVMAAHSHLSDARTVRTAMPDQFERALVKRAVYTS